MDGCLSSVFFRVWLHFYVFRVLLFVAAAGCRWSNSLLREPPGRSDGEARNMAVSSWSEHFVHLTPRFPVRSWADENEYVSFK